MPTYDTPSDNSRLRLRTIVRLRWIAVLGQSVTVFGVYFGLGFDLPIGVCILIIALSAWLNIFLRLRYPATLRLKSPHAFIMLSYDVLQLSALLFLTGGLQNPFALLLGVPVIVSASTQPSKNTVFLGFIAILCTTVLALFSWPLPWYPGETFMVPLLYRIGVWAAVVSGTVFTALYAWRIAKETRQMSDALTATEMVLAREQKLTALDGLAAAAAHELGTPLSTITVIVKELERELPQNSALAEDIQLLRAQANRCREILQTLTHHDGEPDIMFARLPLTHLIEEVAEIQRCFGTPISVNSSSIQGTSQPGQVEPIMLRNPGVIYGLGNIIENAIDFAATKVDVSARWSDASVSITILDDGPGFRPTILENLGEPYVSTRTRNGGSGGKDTHNHGLGLGYFIAKTLLERSGAKIDLSNRETPDTGAVVQIVWPRSHIDVEWSKKVEELT